MRSRRLTPYVIAAALATVPVAQAQRGSDVDDASESCLSMNLVRAARALDDDTILFEMRDGDMYLSPLDRECPGLQRNNRFSYNLRTGARIPRLCHTDTITVIEQSGVGMTCGLGRFEPITQDALDALLRAPNEPAAELTVIDVDVEESEADSEPQAPTEGEAEQQC